MVAYRKLLLYRQACCVAAVFSHNPLNKGEIELRAEFFSESVTPKVNEAIADFVSLKIWGRPGRFEKFCTLGVFDDSGLLGGVVYHNYDPEYGVCELSAGSDSKRWVTRDIVRRFISMPFERLGCQSVFARHSEDRADLRRMWTSFGAVEHIIPRMRGKGAPAECLAVLTDEAWASSRFMAKNKEFA